MIPLFAEIEEPLREVFERAPDGSLYVLPFLRTRTGASLRKPLEKAITAAGLTAWPRTVAQPAGEPTDRTRRAPPEPCRVFVAGQLAGHRAEALPTGPRYRLRQGTGKSGAPDGARNGYRCR